MNQLFAPLLEDIDAQFYKDHSKIQYKLAQTPLNDYPFIGDESILDVGCGDGKITAYISQRIPEGNILGIDKSPSMIALAQETFPRDGYPNMTFDAQDACTFTFNTSFDLITSFSCLHWIKNQKLALENIQKHLRPLGKSIIVTFPRCVTFWDTIDAVATKRKWKKYFIHDPKPYCFLDESKYTELLHLVGFKILLIETTSHVTKFVGKKGFEDYVRGWLPLLRYLPREHHQEFLDEIGTKSLELAPLEEDGYVYHPYEKILIYVQKT